MPKRTDIESILIIGSGPIVIGQACEFDYSGTQACKALREEGYRVVLVNSNPATIMTDPELSDATYIEPLSVEILEKIIEKERPDALLPTLGGQTALNLALDLAKQGILERYNVQLIGANKAAIEKGEDRSLFRDAMEKIGLDIPRSHVVKSMDQARDAAHDIGEYPIIIRPSFTLGGAGGGIAYNKEEFEGIVAKGLEISPVHEVLVEECLLGWKEFEMEVMRDKKDQCVLICAIENVDPMGVHTGDSITVAPAMTLSDKEYQLMRDASFAVMREIGVDTGGSNVQFALDPKTGRMIVIEMNPRVSRSSALASKATGFPIAKIAAKLAVGYTLDELRNDITLKTPACFEPSIDYVVTKIPRFAFEKFPGSDTTLTSSMKSVGEAMAIGRTFKESFQKALRSLEVEAHGLGGGGKYGDRSVKDRQTITQGLAKPIPQVSFFIRYAFLANFTVEEVHKLTHIDPWFLTQIKELVNLETLIHDGGLEGLDADLLREAKAAGFTDLQLAECTHSSPQDIRRLREAFNINRTYHLVDTCAGEFEASTPYYYSSFASENELKPSSKEKIMILGGGPNRIGQGIEFDYCCVHAAYALKEVGYETVMVNSNPETVSTDFDTSDHLFFEPLTLEDVLEIYHQEQCTGAIVQFGGQTPLNLADALKKHGVRVIGTSPEDIHAAEDRQIFKEILEKIGLRQPINATALSPEQAIEMALKIGFPILLRPSFVLGGRGMFIVYELDDLKRVVHEVFQIAPGKPVLLDKFLEDAVELDVDCISDGQTTVIGGMLEHIEFAGVHSGDASMVMPPHTLSQEMLGRVREASHALAKELRVIGLMNVQFAIKDDDLYVLEVNPRASRTIPFISKAIGIPLAKLAARVMAGETLEALGFTQELAPPCYTTKFSVFPFGRFPGSIIALSPEMRSTGEVMGLDPNLGLAFYKAQMAVQPPLPQTGTIFLSVRDEDKEEAVVLAREFIGLGFSLCATQGTAKKLVENGIEVKEVFRLSEGGRPNIIDMIKNDEIDMTINIPSGLTPHIDENLIRREAINHKVCMTTTLSGAFAALEGIQAYRNNELKVRSLQELKHCLA